MKTMRIAFFSHVTAQILGFSLALLSCSALSLLSTADARVFTPEEQRSIGIYEKNSPAVVNVMTMVVNFDFFLNPIPKQGSGSGFIVSKDGYVITNFHVIQNAQKLEVSLSNGKTYTAKLMGGDASTDVALLKIDDPAGFPYVDIGTSSDLVVGESVFAIGNPFGLKSTYTTGVISSLDRSIKTPNNRLVENVIQTDAAINPGNSGGPLLDSEGRVIGMNTAIFSPSGGSAGIGFAIPIDRVNRVVAELKDHGKVIRPYLGLSIGLELNPYLAQNLQLPVKQGLMVAEINPGSPAAKAGLMPGTRALKAGNRMIPFGGDIITKIDGRPATSSQQFLSLVESKRPGDTLTLSVLRAGKEVALPVLLVQRPENL
jgi:S1-C subfamily serine protease